MQAYCCSHITCFSGLYRYVQGKQPCRKGVPAHGLFDINYVPCFFCYDNPPYLKSYLERCVVICLHITPQYGLCIVHTFPIWTRFKLYTHYVHVINVLRYVIHETCTYPATIRSDIYYVVVVSYIRYYYLRRSI